MSFMNQSAGRTQLAPIAVALTSYSKIFLIRTNILRTVCESRETGAGKNGTEVQNNVSRRIPSTEIQICTLSGTTCLIKLLEI